MKFLDVEEVWVLFYSVSGVMQTVYVKVVSSKHKTDHKVMRFLFKKPTFL